MRVRSDRSIYCRFYVTQVLPVLVRADIRRRSDGPRKIAYERLGALVGFLLEHRGFVEYADRDGRNENWQSW